MNTTLSAPATTSKLELIPIQIGFELIADPRDYICKLLLRDGVYEAPETDLVTRILRPGDTCIDAGCHIGYHSCLFAKLVGKEGRVYSFDANPTACLNTRRNLGLNGFSHADVIHAALANIDEKISFHISSDDQTGLSSLGLIPTSKETISVPCLRLETFLKDKHIDEVRLLKIDVEGAEEIVLSGLGGFLSTHVIDFILIECFDERLKLMESSTEKIAAILESAGYTPWEYGVQTPAGWSQAAQVSSRGDCNYLFVDSSVVDNISPISLTAALHWTQDQRAQALSKAEALKQNAEALKQNVEKLQGDIDWLLESIKVHERESAELVAAKRHLEIVLRQIQNSASWRVLNEWRKVRNSLAPENTWARRIYDSMVGNFRSRH